MPSAIEDHQQGFLGFCRRSIEKKTKIPVSDFQWEENANVQPYLIFAAIKIVHTRLDVIQYCCVKHGHLPAFY